MSSNQASDDWLQDLTVVSSERRYPDRHLLFRGVVGEGCVELEGLVQDPSLQQVQVEHYAGNELVSIQVVPLRRCPPPAPEPFSPTRGERLLPSRFRCALDLHRGHNELLIGSFDASGRAVARHLVFRTTRREIFEIFLVAWALAMVLQTFVLQAFKIPSEAMQPTLQQRDQILADKFFYRLDVPRRGDLIVLSTPEDPGSFFVERIVGLPGEAVTMLGRDVQINGVPLVEPYRDDVLPPLGEKPVKPKDWLIPPDQFFVLGDSRGNFGDSRTWGPIPRDRIVGRVLCRYSPISRLGVLR